MSASPAVADVSAPPRPTGRALPRGRAALALAAALTLAGCGGSLCRLGASAEFVALGKNPFAAAQPTPLGRRLHTLEGWRHELYMGYGDYDENTGPIEVSAYNPRWRSFSTKLTFASEAIELYRAIGERLFAPAIDPLGSGRSASVAVGEPDGRWWTNRAVLITHAFDIATLDGTDLWLVGALGTKAVVMRSMDRGRTWATALEVAARSGREQDFARFHFVFAHGGRLYVQAQDHLGGVFPRSTVFDGTGWTDGPDLRPVPNTEAKPLTQAGEVAYLGAEGVMAFDGRVVRSARAARAGIVDLTAADGVLYALDGREVIGTRNLSAWTVVATAPPKTTSIGVLDGYLYAGTADSELYRYCRPVPPFSGP